MTDLVPPGISVDGVTAWFQEHTPADTPLRFDAIKGGHSNLTYTVTDATDHRWVLRRPPLHQVLATAHDMSREHRIISSLAGTGVPVPGAVGLCTDETVNGAPFYVMEFVDGRIIRNMLEVESLSLAERATVSEDLVDVLGRIHSVDLPSVGLDDLGRHEAYLSRQLTRWHGQWEKSKTRELAVVDRVFERLTSQMPEQVGATIVHGDYRLDNCMLGSDGHVAAVLDWEICTLGDPLADVGLLLVYWGDPDTQVAGVPGAPTLAPGFLRPSELLDRYSDHTGRSLDQIDYYVAFGFWKLACIIEGVYSRYIGGAMGEGDKEAWAPFAVQVEMLAEMADARLSGTS